MLYVKSIVCKTNKKTKTKNREKSRAKLVVQQQVSIPLMSKVKLKVETYFDNQ